MFIEIEYFVYRNLKTRKYLCLNELFKYKEVSDIKDATKFNNLCYYPYLPKVDRYIKMLPYEQELRVQKLKKLNRNWLQKLSDKILNNAL